MAQGRRERREPTFGGGADDKGDDLRLSREDRAVVTSRSSDARRTAQKPEPSKGTSSRPAGTKPAKRVRRRSASVFGRLLYWSAVLCMWGLIGIGALVAYHATKLPPIDRLAVPKRPPNVAILAADGSLIANRGETGGRAVELKELPAYLPKAFVAIEDRRFYDHFGIDPIGITRAMVRNVTRSGGPMQGGSTLTQQLAKNLFLTQERTASRKIQEAILALWLERNYSKDQILELYLNRVYFGSGAYGIDAASLRYFGKPAREVTLAEAAILAGLVQSPSRLAPNRNPNGAQARAELVLAAMARERLVSDEMVKLALINPARALKPASGGSFGYAADHVMDVLDDFIGTIETDVVVSTTLDSGLQLAAEKALVDELVQKGEKFGVSQGAFVAMQPDGAIRALVGGRSYGESQYNRAVAARRQPGSAFKPFVYLAALERGLTPDTPREDSPLNLRGWSPENYSRDYRGSVTLTTALSLSLNTVAVRLGLEVGPKTVIGTAQRLGIRSKLEPNASIALGTSEVTPLELVSAYAPFANGGVGVLPYVITGVKTKDGEWIYRRSGGGLGRVVAPETVGMMNRMMRETLVTGTGRKAELPGWDAAGKTGTSQEFRDAWFVGYTSALVAGVWLGNDDGTPTKRVSGGNLPVEVWSRFMKNALSGTPPQPLPGLPSGWGLPALFGGSSSPDADDARPAPAGPVGNGVPTVRNVQPLVPPATIGNGAAAPVVHRSQSPFHERPVPPAPVAQSKPDDGLRPPGLIGGGTQPQAPASNPQPQRQEPSFFGRLFGG
jgi:penicillin-binding protein 1A